MSSVSGHEGYLTVGLYEDGTPGELFITMAKEGSTIGGLMDCLGTAISVALQYGVPAESLVNKFAHQRFEPMGPTTNRNIPFAKSLVDYIFRWLGMEFVPGYREANAPKRPSETRPTARQLTQTVKTVATPHGESDDLTNPAEGRIDPTTTRLGNGKTEMPEGNVPQIIAAGSEQVTIHTSESRDMGSMVSASRTTALAISALDRSHAALMGDAPACDVCGAITMRNGTCYRCMNCGNSMGCS